MGSGLGQSGQQVLLSTLSAAAMAMPTTQVVIWFYIHLLNELKTQSLPPPFMLKTFQSGKSVAK